VKVFFLADAEIEHLRQVAYYESKQPGLGARYLAEVEQAIARICAAPERNPIALSPNLRRLVLAIFPFTVYYRDTGDAIYIAAIAAHRRRPEYWRDRIK